MSAEKAKKTRDDGVAYLSSRKFPLFVDHVNGIEDLQEHFLLE